VHGPNVFSTSKIGLRAPRRLFSLKNLHQNFTLSQELDSPRKVDVVDEWNGDRRRRFQAANSGRKRSSEGGNDVVANADGGSKRWGNEGGLTVVFSLILVPAPNQMKTSQKKWARPFVGSKAGKTHSAKGRATTDSCRISDAGAICLSRTGGGALLVLVRRCMCC